MVDEEVRNAADDFTAAFTDETGFGTAWVLLWLIMEAEHHAMALALIGDDDDDDDDAIASEALKEWAEPQLVAFRRDEEVPMISWRRVARILRNHLPAPADEI
ncbi:hypothetical protein V5E97_35420 [Singulisphaera sp. Ch08]|uniref:Uncharacterized protein n=1 Tax=Singulisphaera sp. Ch08 TaxID=3120278 RepID=A0AAU7CEN6_9BACT